jgi:hypothetical protein
VVPAVAIGCFVIFIATAAASGLIALQISDDIERDLPLQERPSWRLFKLRRFPWKEVKRHSHMYPHKRHLRVWWGATTALMYAIPLGALITSIFRRGS